MRDSLALLRELGIDNFLPFMKTEYHINSWIPTTFSDISDIVEYVVGEII